MLMGATPMSKSVLELGIWNTALLVSGRDLIIGVADIVMCGPQSIIDTRQAMMFVMEISISTAQIDLRKADMTMSAFLMSFFAAEISFSAAEKTAGAVPAGMSVRPSTDQ